MGFCINDPQPKAQNHCIERDTFAPLFATVEGLRGKGLRHTSVFLRTRLERLLETTGIVPTWQVALQRTYQRDSPQWQEFVLALQDIASLCKERKLPAAIFASLNQGTSTTRPTDYNQPGVELRTYLRWYHQAEAAAARAGLTTVNFEEEFRRELTSEPMAVNPQDIHPSARCNEIYARKLAGLIRPLIRGIAPGMAHRSVPLADK